MLSFTSKIPQTHILLLRILLARTVLHKMGCKVMVETTHFRGLAVKTLSGVGMVMIRFTVVKVVTFFLAVTVMTQLFMSELMRIIRSQIMARIIRSQIMLEVRVQTHFMILRYLNFLMVSMKMACLRLMLLAQ